MQSNGLVLVVGWTIVHRSLVQWTSAVLWTISDLGNGLEQLYGLFQAILLSIELSGYDGGMADVVQRTIAGSPMNCTVQWTTTTVQ